MKLSFPAGFHTFQLLFPTKKTFWNFSKKSTSNNKRKATEQIQDSNKKQKLKKCEKNTKITNQNDPENIWLKTSTITLKLQDKIHIEGKELFNDRIIDAAQKIMKTQFNDPLINGFQSTLFKENVKHFKQIDKDMVQILHRGSSGSDHWFTV